MKHYQIFKEQLLLLVKNNASLQQIANFVATSQYCSYLCTKVANKYNVDKDDLFADLVVAILEGKVLNPNILAQRKFSGHHFQFRVIDIARKMLSPQMDEISNSIVIDMDVAIEVIYRSDTARQNQKLDKLIELKIKELNQYQQDIRIPNAQINLKQYCEVVNLSIEELATRCGLPRHKLTRNTEEYRHLLAKLLRYYVNLYQYWFTHQSTYLAEITHKYGGLINVYNNSGFSCSYRKFQKSIKAIDVWQLEQLKINLEKHNV